MTNRNLGKRLERLEGHGVGSGIVVFVNHDGLPRGEMVALWEVEHGPVNGRTLIIVNAVDVMI